jgi:hypothetical protein
MKMDRVLSTLAKCDYLILGAGPAGISAADYLVSKGLHVAVIDRGISDLAYYSATGKYELIKGYKAGGIGGATQQWGGQLLRLGNSEYLNWKKKLGSSATMIEDLESETNVVLEKFKVTIPKYNNAKVVPGTNLSIINSYIPEEINLTRVFQSMLNSQYFHYIEGLEIISIERIENNLYLKTKNSSLIEIDKKILLLALGAVENTALLMRSISNFTPQHYDNLGRNLKDHPHGVVFEVESSLLNWYKNYKILGLNKRLKKTKIEFQVNVNGYIRGGIAEVHLIDSEVSFKNELQIAIAEKSYEKVRRLFLRLCSTLFFTVFQKKVYFDKANIWFQYEQSENRDSILKPTRDGIIHEWQNSQDDLDFISHATRILQEYFENKGFNVSKVRKFQNLNELNLWSSEACHPSGTIPLSKDFSLGVADFLGKIHAIPRTYLLGALLFPTAGWLNPTLLIMAYSRLVVSRILASVK